MDIMPGYSSPIVAAFGNPLLDMHVFIDSTDVLDKYGLNVDCEKEVSEDELSELQEVRNRYKNVTSAGGSAQNTLRMFQWLLSQPHCSVMFGAVGQDETGRTLEALMKSSGVCTKYVYHEGLPTGRCVALVKDEHRALVAHIGSAAVYEPQHLDQKDHLDTLAQSRVVYIEGFFISHSFPVAEKVVTFCKSRGILIAFNLSSVYICKNNTQEVLHLVKCADVVFGNKTAYAILAKSSEQTPKELLILLESSVCVQNERAERKKVDKSETSSSVSEAVALSDIRLTSDTLFSNLQSHGKIFIATHGPNPIKCKTTHGECLEVQVPALDSASVKDTTGAGDAFVAGFLVGMVQQRQLEACIKLGCHMAARVIQHVGCQVPTCSPSEIMNAA